MSPICLYGLLLSGLTLLTACRQEEAPGIPLSSNPPQNSPQNHADINWALVRSQDIANTFQGWRTAQWLPTINSTGWEDGAFIFADHQKLAFIYTNSDVFSSGAPTSGPTRVDSQLCHVIPCGVYPRADVYVSEKDSNGIWQTPRPHPLTLPLPIGGLHQTDFYAYFMQDKGQKMDLFQSQRAGDSWSTPAPIINLNSPYADEDPSVSDDLQSLYFWSDRPASWGGKNIYLSENMNSIWELPVLMPAPINSHANDMQPFIHGNSLYFASDRNGGILKIYRSDKSNNQWSEPVVIVESQFGVGEPTLTFDGRHLYFVQIFQHQGKYNPDIMVSHRD